MRKILAFALAAAFASGVPEASAKKASSLEYLVLAGKLRNPDTTEHEVPDHAKGSPLEYLYRAGKLKSSKPRVTGAQRPSTTSRAHVLDYLRRAGKLKGSAGRRPKRSARP